MKESQEDKSIGIFGNSRFIIVLLLTMLTPLTVMFVWLCSEFIAYFR